MKDVRCHHRNWTYKHLINQQEGSHNWGPHSSDLKAAKVTLLDIQSISVPPENQHESSGFPAGLSPNSWQGRLICRGLSLSPWRLKRGASFKLYSPACCQGKGKTLNMCPLEIFFLKAIITVSDVDICWSPFPIDWRFDAYCLVGFDWWFVFCRIG